ncbi:ComF family protein [candidate division KSB1 bacterium]|nr:MAG: ComF family protein [candidate division KSB1 bacterium]
MTVLIHPRAWPIWDLFFPPLCRVCGHAMDPEDLLFCDQCWADAPVADAHDLRPLKYVDMVRAGFRFGGDDVVRSAVHALKFDGMKLVSRSMAQHLIARLPTRFVEADLVWTTVPLHWFRRAFRGFNQSDMLGCELAGVTGHAAPVPLLRRIRHTPSQTAQSYRVRAANVRDAFTVIAKNKLPEAVLIIDDVITTGATVDECAKALKEKGVKWVGVLAFALTHRS